jgi:hypothetical protein
VRASPPDDHAPRPAARAPHAPAPARAAAKDVPPVKPTRTVKTDARQPRRPLLADPDDVLGPEM